VAALDVPLSRLRPLWLALPFLPWLAWLVPWFAPFVSVPWFLLALYFWPVVALASWLGLPLESEHSIAIYSFPYCLAIAWILDLAVRGLGKRRGAWRRIRARTAVAVAAASAAGVIGLLAVRYAQWIDWPPHAAQVGDLPYPLRAYAPRLAEFAAYDIPSGPLDREYAVRIRAESGVLSELVDALDLEPLPGDRVSPEFWNAAAAYWWDPPHSGQFHVSPGFPWSDRGPDGDYYCALQVPAAGELWIWHKSNF
jgi:hypothetical protein